MDSMENKNSINQELTVFQSEINEASPLPFFSSPISAGFPSAAEDHVENRLDLNRLLVQHPAATFFVRVEGESMRDAGIQTGDIAIVDRALVPESGRIVVAIINGEFTMKRLVKKENRLFLVAENPQFKTIELLPEMEFEIWGVVTYVIHKVR
jgi:DNA polymerase V